LRILRTNDLNCNDLLQIPNHSSFEPGEHQAEFFLEAPLPSSAPIALVRANRPFIEHFCQRKQKAPRLFESTAQGSFADFHDEDPAAGHPKQYFVIRCSNSSFFRTL
jgi:hypothetical protein